MNTTLEQSRADLVVAMQGYQAQLRRELGAVTAAIEELTGPEEVQTTAPAERVATRKAKRKPTRKPARTPKASKRPAKRPRAAKQGAAAPKRQASDEPRSVRGRLPSANGEQVYACGSDEDRQRKLAELKEQGLRRVSALERLSAGTYDVRTTGDGAVILWIPKAEA